MKKLFLCLLAMVFASCRPPGSADSDESPTPVRRTPTASTPAAGQTAAASPAAKSGDWMWKKGAKKKTKDLSLKIKDDALDATPGK